MSDTTTYPAAPTTPVQPGPFGGPPASVAAPPKPVAPVPTPKEPDIKERASNLLSTMTDAQRHNAPITPWMLTELAAVVGQVTGNKAVVVPHLILNARGLPDDIMLRKPDGTVTVVYSVEEALAYVRSLPADVQKRAHWVAADNALVDAIASVPGADVSPAIRLFSAALAEDRKLDVKPVEIKDKPADDTAKKADANMEAQRQAQAKAATEAQLRANAATPPGTPAPVPA
jgi:hypothetical protein